MAFHTSSNFSFLSTCHLAIYGDGPEKRGFPGDTVVKNLLANAEDSRDTGSTPGLGRSLGVGNGNQLQILA